MRQTEARGEIDCDQCSWKLDSSTAMTSKGSGWRTASRRGVPTLPALVARSPAARRIDASIWTVVVLPFVPVTVSHGAAPSRGRIRQASSTSPHTGMPRAAASARSGWSGRHPGEVTTRSTSAAGIPATAEGPKASRAPRMSRMCAFWAMTDPLRRVGAVDDEDVGPALEEGVGRGEAAEPQPGDDDAQPRPAGVTVGQPGEPILATGTRLGGAGHAAPTTHSA